MSYFALNLKKIRQLKRLSQTEFAKIFGMTRATVGAYEEGRAEPKIDKLIEIANYFGLTVDQLVRKRLTVNEISHYQDKVKHSLETIPFVPLSEKKSFIEAVVEQKDFKFNIISVPGMMADLALEVEEFAGLRNVIVFARNVVQPQSLRWFIGITRKDYKIFIGNENFDGLIKFWNVCCLLTKDIDNLVHTEARLQRIEAKIDYLINTSKN